jgi:hypothetical protein
VSVVGIKGSTDCYVLVDRLKAALLPDEDAQTQVQDIHTRLVDAFPFPPAIPAPTTANDLLPIITGTIPGVRMLEGEQVTARLQAVDFEHCAEIWASVGWDLTIWVLQYVQSRLSVNKVKGGIKEEGLGIEGHGLVGTGVSLTCGPGNMQVDEAREDSASKAIDVAVKPQTSPSTDKLPLPPPLPPLVNKPAKPAPMAAPVDKIPDSEFTLLNTNTLPFPHLSIRKNFRTIVVETIPVSKIIPLTTAESTVAPATNGMPPVEVNAEEPEVKTFERIVSTGKYTAQVLGKPGSMRVAKAWYVSPSSDASSVPLMHRQTGSTHGSFHPQHKTSHQ